MQIGGGWVRCRFLFLVVVPISVPISVFGGGCGLIGWADLCFFFFLVIVAATIFLLVVVVVLAAAVVVDEDDDVGGI